MPEDVPPGGTGALLHGKRNLENSLSFLFRRFFLRRGGCWGWCRCGFELCEVASHELEFLHRKLLRREERGGPERFVAAAVGGEGYGYDGFLVGRQ